MIFSCYRLFLLFITTPFFSHYVTFHIVEWSIEIKLHSTIIEEAHFVNTCHYVSSKDFVSLSEWPFGIWPTFSCRDAEFFPKTLKKYDTNPARRTQLHNFTGPPTNICLSLQGMRSIVFIMFYNDIHLLWFNIHVCFRRLFFVCTIQNLAELTPQRCPPSIKLLYKSDFQHAGSGKCRIQVPSFAPCWKS